MVFRTLTRYLADIDNSFVAVEQDAARARMPLV